MSLKYIDIGVNLTGKQFDADREKVVEESLKDGVGLIITGTDLKSNAAALNYIDRFQPEYTWCTCGIHPHNADQWGMDYAAKLKKQIGQSRRVVALGEAGLDYDRMFSAKENQRKCFSDILDLAEELKLPLFLHERAAEADFTKMLKDHRGLCQRSVVHCFTGGRATAYRYLQLGCLIGITGWICDSRRNKELVEAMKIIPLERLMIETDAPYLAPLDVKGINRRNVPGNIKYVTEKIAELKGVDPEEVRRITLGNTLRFFNLRGI